MRNRGIAAAVVCAGLAAVSAGPLPGQRARSFGLAANDQPGSMLIAADGDLVVSGYSQYTGQSGQQDAWLWVFKTDREGRVVWTHFWRAASHAEPFNRSSAVLAAPDGGWFLAATGKPRDGTDSHVLLVKLNPAGAIVWQKTYGFDGGGAGDAVFRVREACAVRGGDGILIVGAVQPSGSTDWNLWAARFDNEGRPVWQREYAGPDLEEGYAVGEESDGTFYVGGRTLSYGAGAYDFWALNLTGQGDVVWQKTFGTGLNDSLFSLDIAPGGGCFLAGESQGPGGERRAWILKLDRTGAVEWQNAFGVAGGASARAVRATPDGGAVVTGGFYLNRADALFVMKLAAGGAIERQLAFGESTGPDGSSDEGGLALVVAADGAWSIGGTSVSLGASDQDLLLLDLSPTREEPPCSFLRAAGPETVEFPWLSFDTAARFAPTFAVPSGLAMVEDPAIVWLTQPVCPTKSKGLRR